MCGRPPSRPKIGRLLGVRSIGPDQSRATATAASRGCTRRKSASTIRARRPFRSNGGADAAAEGDAPASLAERDAAAARRVVVVDHHLRVRHALAAGPADLREAFRRRLGHDHVARDGHERAGELADSGGPGVRREDETLGAKSAAAGAADCDRPSAAERGDPGVLVDPDSGAERRLPQSAGEDGRLHRRRRDVEDSRAVDGRARASRDLFGREAAEGPHSEFLAERDDALPRAHLRRGRRGPEPPAAAELRVEAVRARRRPRSRRSWPRTRASRATRPTRRRDG